MTLEEQIENLKNQISIALTTAATSRKSITPFDSTSVLKSKLSVAESLEIKATSLATELRSLQLSNFGSFTTPPIQELQDESQLIPRQNNTLRNALLIGGALLIL